MSKRMSDPHEFCEDVNDYSMCVCGIAAGAHDAVMLRMTSKAPSSPVETTDGSARPIPPDAPNGLTGGREDYTTKVWRLTDVLARMPGAQLIVNEYAAALRATIVELSDALAEARATIPGLRDTIAVLTRVIQGHDRERQGFKAAIAQRDAMIERLWAQLLEAAGLPARIVPDRNDPEFGFDKTAALSEPGFPVQTAMYDKRPKYEPEAKS